MATHEEFIKRAIEQNPIEARIIKKIVKALSKTSDPIVETWDREENVQVKTLQDVFDVAFNLDEVYLITRAGSWVRLTMGEGWDVICDYTMDLDAALVPVNDYIAKYGE